MKKLIKKYIIKYLLKYFDGNRSSKDYQYVRDHFKFYLFLRWLAEFVKDKENTVHVIASIASYMYCNKLYLPFTDIFVIDNVVCIYTIRPGSWIGKSGSTIDEITKKINFNLEEKQTHNFKITLLETTQGAVIDILTRINTFNDYYL